MFYIYNTCISNASHLKSQYMKPGKNFILAIILSVTFLSFANTLSSDFTNMDDDRYVILNPRIRDLSASGIAAIFSSMDLNLYTPLTTLSFAVDYALWGLNPAGYHAVNLILHLLNTWLVFLFCARLSRSVITAGIAACLFGVHPVHVESVAWIAERKDLLFTIFAMSSLLLYDNYRQYPKKRLVQTAGVFMFLCSLLAKPQAAALPAVLLLMDYFRDIPFCLRRSLVRIWPFAALTVILCGLTLYFSIVSYDPGVYAYANTSVYAWWNRPFLVTYGICFYIVKLIWPFNLTAIYACPPEAKGMLPLVYYLSAFGIAGLSWAAWRLWKRKNDFVFGAFFFLLMLLPVVQIIPFGQVVVAERYAYLSSVGLFLIAGQLVAGKIREQSASRYPWGMAVMFVMLGLAWLTHERNKVWANSETLCTDIIAKNPRIALAYNNRGVARSQREDYAGAGRDYDEAIRLEPRYVQAFFNRGVLRGQTRNVTGALSDYNIALALDPYYAEAYCNRGFLLDTQGDAEHALRDFTDAIRLKPEFEAAFAARGVIRAERGQYDQALADLKCALQLNPTNAVAYFNLGKVYLALSNSAAARLCMENAYSLGLRPEQNAPAKHSLSP